MKKLVYVIGVLFLALLIILVNLKERGFLDRFLDQVEEKKNELNAPLESE